jgi:hypothetical protein
LTNQIKEQINRSQFTDKFILFIQEMNPENIGSAAADDAEQQKELANLGIR